MRRRRSLGWVLLGLLAVTGCGPKPPAPNPTTLPPNRFPQPRPPQTTKAARTPAAPGTPIHGTS